MSLRRLVDEVIKKECYLMELPTEESVILDALCAHMEKLMMSDEWDTQETRAKIMILENKINEILNRIAMR